MLQLIVFHACAEAVWGASIDPGEDGFESWFNILEETREVAGSVEFDAKFEVSEGDFRYFQFDQKPHASYFWKSKAAPCGDSCVIPNTIFFTGQKEPEQIVENNRRWVEPNTTFEYYDDARLEESVSEISNELEKLDPPVKGAYEAFRSLRAMAYRADLWRYMILWQKGGLYLDHKLKLSAPVDKWFDRSKDVVYSADDREASRHDDGGVVLWNAVIAAKQHDPGLLQAIRSSIENIQAKKYSFSSKTSAQSVMGMLNALYLTGPGLLGRSLRLAGREVSLIGKFTHEAFGSVDGEVLSQAVLDDHNTPVIKTEASAHEESGGVYAALWAHGGVFCSEPNPLEDIYDPCQANDMLLSQTHGQHHWSRTVSP